MNEELSKLSTQLLQLEFSTNYVLSQTLLILKNQKLLFDLIYQLFQYGFEEFYFFVQRFLPDTEKITLTYNILTTTMKFQPLVPIFEFGQYEHYHNIKIVRVLAKFIYQLKQMYSTSKLEFNDFMNISFKWQYWSKRIESQRQNYYQPQFINYTPQNTCFQYQQVDQLPKQTYIIENEQDKTVQRKKSKKLNKQMLQKAELKLQKKYGKCLDQTAKTASTSEGKVEKFIDEIEI